MKTDYSHITKEQAKQILNDFYNYVMDEHDCILRNEQIDLFVRKRKKQFKIVDQIETKDNSKLGINAFKMYTALVELTDGIQGVREGKVILSIPLELSKKIGNLLEEITT